jgi:hypothetical protein
LFGENKEKTMRKRRFIIVLMAILLLSTAFEAYAQQTTPPIVSILLNTIPGLGVGSFAQGDTTAGVILLSADLASVGLILLGIVHTFSLNDFELDLFSIYPDSSPKKPHIESPLTYIGAVLFGCSKVLGIILPLCYHPPERPASDDAQRSEDSRLAGGTILPIELEPRLNIQADNLSYGFAMTVHL